MKYKVELALGTNLGDRKNNLTEALLQVDLMIGKIIFQTKAVETEPVDYLSPNKFLNMIVLVETENSPVELLRNIKSIEKKLGRKFGDNPSGNYEDRPIDIDILKFENISFISSKLKIPHDKINKRFFFNINWLNNQ